MTSMPDLYDANVPSDGLTFDTDNGPVDTVAVMRHVSGETGITLTRVEAAVAARLDPNYYRHRPRAFTRAAAYERLAQSLLSDAA